MAVLLHLGAAVRLSSVPIQPASDDVEDKVEVGSTSAYNLPCGDAQIIVRRGTLTSNENGDILTSGYCVPLSPALDNS